MGIFDMVFVACPHCGAQVEFQSKADEDAYMRHFTLDTAPVAIVQNIMNSPEHCEKCDGWLALVDPDNPLGPPPRPKLTAVKVRTPENPKTHFQGMKWWPENLPFTVNDLDLPAPSNGRGDGARE